MSIKELLEKARSYTDYDYLSGDMIDTERLITALEDMIIEYENLKMEFDDYKQEVEDNMRPLTPAEQIGSAVYRGF